MSCALLTSAGVHRIESLIPGGGPIPDLIPFPGIDPVLFSVDIFGITFAVRWYALAYVAGFIAAWAWISRLVANPRLWRDGTPAIGPEQLERLVTWMIIGVILGGRIGFAAFYNPWHYLAQPAGILRIWEGGMSFHGGLIGIIAAGWLFCRKHKLPMAGVGDAIACAAPIGLCLGRIANFVNAELWGRPSDVPWAVVFPGQAAGTCPEWWAGEVCSRHPSQIYQAGLEGVALFALLAFLSLRRGWLRTPGQLTATFLIGYGLARLAVESFREADRQFVTPDNPLGYIVRLGPSLEDFGLTMGQLLSLPMIAAGIVIFVLVRTRERRVDSQRHHH